MDINYTIVGCDDTGRELSRWRSPEPLDDAALIQCMGNAFDLDGVAAVSAYLPDQDDAPVKVLTERPAA